MRLRLITEIKKLPELIKQCDKTVVWVLLSVAVIETTVWYYGARRFFRAELAQFFGEWGRGELAEYIYWFVANAALYLIPTMLILVLVLKRKPREFGFSFGDYRAGFYYTGLFLGVMIPIIWIVSSTQAFSNMYPHHQPAKVDWELFLIYEAGMLLYMIGWEYIWRGYLLFGLYEKFGYHAVLIQMIPFVLLHFGKPPVETYSSILGGIALGVLALRTGSFWYGVIIHFGIMFSLDLFSSLRYRAAEFGIGPDALFRIVGSFF